MSIIKILISVLLLLMTIFTSFQFLRKDAWYIRAFDFPHVQLTVLNLIFLSSLLLLADYQYWLDITLCGLGLLTFIYQATIIYPYTPLSKKLVVDSHSKNGEILSILEANVFMDNTNYSGLITLVKRYRPQIVVTLETNSKWKDGMKELETLYEHKILHPLENTYGICFYSNLKFSDAKIHHLIDEEIPSFEITLHLKSGKSIKLFVVHPEPPSPSEKEVSTPRDAEMVLVGKKVKECTLPVIVTGDLNDVAWSHTTRVFQRISGLLDPRIGRGFFNTFHVKYPLLRWPLDHIFVSKDFTINKICRLPSFGSDHFPMYVKLQIPEKTPDGNTEQDKPDNSDMEEAEETVEKARVSNEKK